ncbi:hypothetical protein VPH35_079248 [Triticum aestivum]
MEPGGPPRPAPCYAGGPAGYRGEASSSSSPAPRPPPPQQQQHQGHAVPPVGMPQPSTPWGPGAGAPPFFGFGPPVPGPIPPLHPQFGSQQYPGDIYYSLGPPMPIHPLAWTPSYLDAMGPHNWSDAFRPAVLPISNSDMVAAPQPPQFLQNPPWFEPLPPQPYVYVGQPVPRIYQDSRLAQIRSELLSRSPMTLEQLVMSLDQEYLEILMVLDGFKRCAHGFMGNRQGHAVFEALLGSFHGHYRGLEIIVKAAVTPRLVPRSDDGVASLELLITAVASSGFAPLSGLLVESFLKERVMDDDRGDELIVHCFTTMPINVTAALINHAIYTIDDKMLSPSGTKFLATCFLYAQDEEVPRFQTEILANAVAMAKQRAGKYFVLHLLDHASSMEFRKQLASNLMQDVLHLSRTCQGQFVVEHCVLSEEKELLNIALRACAGLASGDLKMLVTQRASRNFVLPLLQSLLERGNTAFPEIAKELAHKIEALPPHIRKYDDLELLMSAVRSVLADNLPNLGD